MARVVALAESFFATLKNEDAGGTYPAKAAARTGIAKHIHGFYNPTWQTLCARLFVAG